jgi:hypothetical protein
MASPSDILSEIDELPLDRLVTVLSISIWNLCAEKVMWSCSHSDFEINLPDHNITLPHLLLGYLAHTTQLCSQNASQYEE